MDETNYNAQGENTYCYHFTEIIKGRSSNFAVLTLTHQNATGTMWQLRRNVLSSYRGWAVMKEKLTIYSQLLLSYFLVYCCLIEQSLFLWEVSFDSMPYKTHLPSLTRVYSTLQTFKPWYKNAYSPYCSPYISYGTSNETVSKYQDILSLVITCFILITFKNVWTSSDNVKRNFIFVTVWA